MWREPTTGGIVELSGNDDLGFFLRPEVDFSKKLTVWEFSGSRTNMKVSSCKNHIYCENVKMIKYNTKRCNTFSANDLYHILSRMKIMKSYYDTRFSFLKECDTNDWLNVCYTVTHSFSGCKRAELLVSYSGSILKTSAVCGPYLQPSAAEEVDQTSAVYKKKTLSSLSCSSLTIPRTRVVPSEKNLAIGYFCPCWRGEKHRAEAASEKRAADCGEKKQCTGVVGARDSCRRHDGQALEMGRR
ncbi:hypothetical protein LXL04_008500 [Taraxacum kok-saghyz]